MSALTGENKTLCHDLYGKDKLLFDSYATVNKLEKQLDNMVRTSSNQEEKLLQMEEVQQLQTELQSKQIMLDESNLPVHKLQRSRRRFKNISKKLQTTETIVDKISTIKRLQS